MLCCVWHVDCVLTPLELVALLDEYRDACGPGEVTAPLAAAFRALPTLPAVFMAVAMPPTVLVLVVQNHPSASLATASCRAGGTRHTCGRCTSRRPPSVPLFVRGLAPSPRAPYLWRPRSGSPPR